MKVEIALCKGITTRGKPCKKMANCGEFCVHHRAKRCIDLRDVKAERQKRKDKEYIEELF